MSCEPLSPFCALPPDVVVDHVFIHFTVYVTRAQTTNRIQKEPFQEWDEMICEEYDPLLCFGRFSDDPTRFPFVVFRSIHIPFGFVRDFVIPMSKIKHLQWGGGPDGRFEGVDVAVDFWRLIPSRMVLLESIFVLSMVEPYCSADRIGLMKETILQGLEGGYFERLRSLECSADGKHFEILFDDSGREGGVKEGEQEGEPSTRKTFFAFLRRGEDIEATKRTKPSFLAQVLLRLDPTKMKKIRAPERHGIPTELLRECTNLGALSLWLDEPAPKGLAFPALETLSVECQTRRHASLPISTWEISRVQSVTLHGVKDLGQVLEALHSRLSDLQELYLWQSFFEPGRKLESRILRWNGLKKLTLRQFFDVTIQEFLSICQFPDLEILSGMQGSNYVVPLSEMPRLRTLYLTIGAVADRSWGANLEKLTLFGNAGQELKVPLECMVSGCLRKVEVSRASEVARKLLEEWHGDLTFVRLRDVRLEQDFNPFGRAVPEKPRMLENLLTRTSLKTLDLGKCDISDAYFREAFPSLVRLSISDCRKITGDWSGCCFPSLEYLSFAADTYATLKSSLFSSVEAFPSLKSLSLTRIGTDGTSWGVFSKVLSLRVSVCRELSDVLFESPTRFPSLVTLDVVACDGITGQGWDFEQLSELRVVRSDSYSLQPHDWPASVLLRRGRGYQDSVKKHRRGY